MVGDVIKEENSNAVVQAQVERESGRHVHGRKCISEVEIQIAKECVRWGTGPSNQSAEKSKSKPSRDAALHAPRWLQFSKLKLASVGEESEKYDPLYNAGGNVKGCSSHGKVWGFLKKVQRRVAVLSSNVILALHPKYSNFLKTEYECSWKYSS